jgi:hypothetical protein
VAAATFAWETRRQRVGKAQGRLDLDSASPRCSHLLRLPGPCRGPSCSTHPREPFRPDADLAAGRAENDRDERCDQAFEQHQNGKPPDEIRERKSPPCASHDYLRVGTAHKNRKVNLLVAGPDVRIITDDGELLRALTIDPTRNYQPLGGRWPVHNVLQQACTMS